MISSWPSEHRSRPNPAKDFLAVLCAILLVATNARATSIVILATKHGIVIGADGKIVHKDDNLRPAPSTIGTKIVPVGNRMVVAGSGITEITRGTVTGYSFASFADFLQTNVSSNTTVTDLVAIIKARLSLTFDGFDVMLKSGKMGIPLTQVAPISSMPGWGQKSIRGM